ncbi:hypothetical protein JB92DRAFT_2068772 [Gautieria morchelliformis]|nr:hypothetical protein JB92DRAFT_2068772 [Gautieria morchelliformis]
MVTGEWTCMFDDNDVTFLCDLNIQSMCFSPDRRYLAMGGYDNIEVRVSSCHVLTSFIYLFTYSLIPSNSPNMHSYMDYVLSSTCTFIPCNPCSLCITILSDMGDCDQAHPLQL